MRVVGIVAEYNPLHKGHEYQIKRARELSGADAVCVCMSGNFTQRGDIAVKDKWERASWAIDAGADLVIELPTFFAASDAGRFAGAGAKLLEGIGCNAISMGSECGDSVLLKLVSDRLGEIEPRINEYMKANPSSGYPAARAVLYKEVFEDSETLEAELKLIESPNDILALEYIKNAGSMDIVPVTRLGAGYNDSEGEFEFQSATGIRELVARGDNPRTYVPSYVNLDGVDIAGREETFLGLVRYAILSKEASEIDNMPSGGEGLGAKLKQEVISAGSIDELIKQTKSKRYTYTRIARLLVQLVLEIDRSIYEAEPRYARVLAFNKTGQAVLKNIKDREDGPTVITNLSKQLEKLDDNQAEMLMLDIHAANIYSIITKRDIKSHSDYINKPIIK